MNYLDNNFALKEFFILKQPVLLKHSFQESFLILKLPVLIKHNWFSYLHNIFYETTSALLPRVTRSCTGCPRLWCHGGQLVKPLIPLVAFLRHFRVKHPTEKKWFDQKLFYLKLLVILFYYWFCDKCLTKVTKW